ncbi:hypothetical protein [Micrococcoides hystricis]|uniref:Uncharacterized protein n=1 Tax=Micrococcoides hystricis TaxID=1572761 RepID=A0ABV6P8Z0_9MICC
MKNLKTANGKKILATSFAAALLFATGCQANGTNGDASPQTTEQQTVTESAPVVTETATENAETAANDQDGTDQSGDAGSEQGEPVSTSNGGYTITPVGEWEANLKQIDDPQQEGYDPVEDIELAHPAGSGAVSTGVITSGDVAPPEDVENLNSTRLEELDDPNNEDAGETYLIEQIIKPQPAEDGQEEPYRWHAAIVTKGEGQESEFDATMYSNSRLPSGAFISVSSKPDTTGDASKEEAENFAKSGARDDAIEMLKTLKVEQQGENSNQ